MTPSSPSSLSLAGLHDPARPLLALLHGVSRSFYLSIRVLPAVIRQPVAVAYLLARASDTIADTASIPAALRREQLQLLIRAIEGDAAAGAAIGSVAAAFTAVQHDEAERRLIFALPQCMSWMDSLREADRRDVMEVLRKITHGQALDLDRFGDGAHPRALANANELDEYTYLVAGSVGEFWTAVCARHLPGFARQPIDEMCSLGKDFGMGLQLVNILRDVPADLAAGRCYLPADELAAAGLTPQGMAHNPERLAPILQRWCGVAGRRLEAGMRYAQAVENRRVRAACALPALIGARTLGLLQQQGPLSGGVKMPRRDVRWMVARMAITLAGRASLQAQFRRMRM